MKLISNTDRVKKNANLLSGNATNLEAGDSMLSRRQARRLALQILFCNEFLKEDILPVAERIAATLQQQINPFCKTLILTTHTHRLELDNLIHTNLRNWDIERIAMIDRLLLRLALSELLYFPEIPLEVTINEAMELGKEFDSYKGSRFINGILDTILKQLEKDHRLPKKIVAHVSTGTKQQ